MKYNKQTGKYENGKPVGNKEKRIFSIGEIIQMTEKVMEKIRAIKIRPKKNRNNIMARSKADRASIDNKGGK
jgi:hypothetical protein